MRCTGSGDAPPTPIERDAASSDGHRVRWLEQEVSSAPRSARLDIAVITGCCASCPHRTMHAQCALRRCTPCTHVTCVPSGQSVGFLQQKQIKWRSDTAGTRRGSQIAAGLGCAAVG